MEIYMEPDVPIHRYLEMDIDMNEKALVCFSDRETLGEGNMAPPEPEVPIYIYVYRYR